LYLTTFNTQLKISIMLDQIMDLVKQHAGDAIINNNAIPNEHNDTAIATTGNSIMESLQQAIGSGGSFAGIQDLLMGGGLQQNVATSLQNQLGIDSGAASGVAGSIVPNVLSGLMEKVSSSGIDINSILGNLSGGGNLSDMLGNITSQLDANKDGKTDLGDLGGLADGLKGLFK
jgi:hypothetical protein